MTDTCLLWHLSSVARRSIALGLDVQAVGPSEWRRLPVAGVATMTQQGGLRWNRPWVRPARSYASCDRTQDRLVWWPELTDDVCSIGCLVTES